jgi:hypothetical protein
VTLDTTTPVPADVGLNPNDLIPYILFPIHYSKLSHNSMTELGVDGKIILE